MTVLDQKYPSYHRLVHEHLQKDPERPFRVMAQLQFLRQSPRRKYLFVVHRLGGGVIKHLEELAEHVGQDVDFIFLKPGDGETVEIGSHYGPYSWSLFFNIRTEYHELLDFLRAIPVERSHVHHVMGVPDGVLSLLVDLAVPYDVTLHDYYFVNANPTLTNREGVFAEDPASRDQYCSEAYPLPAGIPVADWRLRYGELMSNAERVFAPTARCRDVYLDYFPGLPVQVAYHPEWEQSHPYVLPSVPAMVQDERLRVLVVGAMSREKGADVLERTATYRDPLGRLEYHLLGYAYRPLAPEVIQHGPYDDSRLDELIAELKPHLFWFPAQWHETYCYALSAALRSGVPILASDLGAFPERLQGRPLSFIKSWRSTPIEWHDTMLQIRDWLLSHQDYRSDPGDWIQPSLEGSDSFLYSRDYVVTAAPVAVPSRDLPDFERLVDWCYPHAGGDMKLSAREKLLYWLVRLREMPGVHHILRLVPFELQRQIKRRFSHRPIHDIVNEQRDR